MSNPELIIVPTVESTKALKEKLLKVLNEYEKGYITLEEERNKLVDMLVRYLAGEI